MGNPFLEGKVQRLKAVRKLIEVKQPVTVAKIKALIQFQFGVSEKTANNYIKTLHNAEIIEINNGKLSIKQ